ncbi:hypothetical protein SAMN04489712_101127 [Thermomonospora echinospora]|uniref:PE-PGRS family protein n=1 Tax=Thermomonospora echinospora TaxID=1992 RepID=A0A1H5SA59_9ACTN|nr:DUF5954 family protein [Thermomonospora echinospora]SEF47290.1 hypothetical protein SAMN04489712_101127 [Thermomonospora echinospora]
MTMGDGDAGGRIFPEDLDAVDPVAAVMLADARRSLSTYPDLVVAGPLFAPAEQVPGGWQAVCPCDPLPQGARELLAAHLRNRGAVAGRTAGRDFQEAARRLEDGSCDELSVLARRFRIVRIEQLMRTGADGPEPPRPTDHDPRPPGPGRPVPRRPPDFIADPARDTRGTDDIVTAELLCQYLDEAARHGSEPAEPFLAPVQLAPMFTVAERSGQLWRPGPRLYGLPQEARDSLVTYFRHVVPSVERPDPLELAEYAEAADLMEDGQRRNGIVAAGRRFRIVRVERMVLVGPDGPETPRPSDRGL